MRRAPTVALVLVLAVSLAGCLGSFAPAGIPADSLTAGGTAWSMKSENDSRIAAGLVPLTQREYAPANAAGSVLAGVLIITAGTPPFVPVDRVLPHALAQVEESEGIRFEQKGETPMTLTNVGDLEVSARHYDVKGAGMPAEAVLVDFYCEDPHVYVVGLAYGANDSGLLGSMSPFEQSKRLLSRIACDVS